MKITVISGQSLYDIALQHAGSPEAVVEIAQANYMSLDTSLEGGRELEIPTVHNKKLVDYYKQNNIIITTEYYGTDDTGNI
jgi:hypothetical protein